MASRKRLDVYKRQVLFDGRNIYEAEQLAELGFLYRGIGRPASGSCKASAA